MKPFIDSRLYVNKTTHKGWGIFTKQKIEKGTIVEVSIPTKIKYKEISEGNSKVYNWIYTGEPYSDLGTGFASCINHGPKPNVGFYGENGFLVYHATRNIEANEEICLDYGIEDWGKPEKKVVFNNKKLNDYIYVDSRLYLDLSNPKNQSIKNLDSYLKRTLNSNLLYHVFAKENIAKDTVIEIAMCGIFERKKCKVPKDSTLKALYYYDKKGKYFYLPFGYANLYAINEERANVKARIINQKFNITTRRNIRKGERLFLKSRTI